MAIDTVAKRSSAIHIGSPWRSPWPIPDATLDAGDRLHMAFLYQGIAAQRITVSDSLLLAEGEGWWTIRGTRWEAVEGIPLVAEPEAYMIRGTGWEAVEGTSWEPVRGV